MQQTDKTGFLRLFQIAVAKPKEYKKALTAKKRSIVGFVLLISFVAVVLGTLVPVLSFGISIGGPTHFITETLPDFEYKDGTFYIEDRVEIVQSGIRIIADSDTEEFTRGDLEEDTIAEILISKNNLLMKNTYASQGNVNIDFGDAGSGTVTNEDLLVYLPLIYASIAIVVIMMLFITIYQYLISALIYAVCGRSLARTMKKDLSFGKCYVLALLAKATVEIINRMGMAADITFMNSMLWVFISFGIVMVYLYLGIREIGADRTNPEF